ncbi:hypothetical protein BH09VER1_BH09VER1_03890 [soil metagenome]
MAGRFLRCRGFTLVEILVAVAVLALMLFVAVQLINGVSVTVGQSGKRMDSDTQARLIFNKMALDIAKMVLRSDVDYSPFKQPAATLSAAYGGASFPANLQPGNDHLAFYSETTGYFSGTSQPLGSAKAPISLVAYMIASDSNNASQVLRRLGKGLGWEPDSNDAWKGMTYLPTTITSQWPNLFTLTSGSNTDPDYKTVGSQIFRIEYTYLLKSTSSQAARLSLTPWDTSPAHTSIDGFKDVAAIVVSIGVLDYRSRILVKDYPSLIASLPDARDPASDATYHGDIAAAWNAIVNAPGFATAANLPPNAAAAVRIYQRYFYLDTTR